MKRKRLAVLMAGLDKEYQREYADGLLETAEQNGADLFFFVCQGFPETARVVNEASESRIFSLPVIEDYDGVITLSRTFPDADSVVRVEDALRASKHIPQVFLDNPGDYGTRIDFDDLTSMRALVDHMVAVHGCRTFALVTGPKGNPVADARANACRETIAEHSGSILLIRDGRWTSLGGRQAALELLKLEKLPDVVICGNDDMAMAVIACLQENGIRVPQDVRVTGFDARRDALAQGLTTIRRPVFRAGILSVRHLLDQQGDEHIHLPTELLLGTSCGCAPNRHRFIPRQDRKAQNRVEEALLRGVGFTSRMCATSNLQEAGRECVNFARLWKANDFHIAVDPDFFTTTDSGRSIPGPAELLLLGGVHGEHEQVCVPFRSKELLPGLSDRSEAAALVFLPLYYQDKSFGYAVVDLERAASIAMLPLQTLVDCALTELSQRLAIHAYIETLQKLTLHDPLTGLPNRRGFYAEAERLMTYAREHQQFFAVLSADMDGMKHINDTYGHMFGDEAIRRMGHAMNELCNEQIVCAHLSGDEFMMAGTFSSSEAAKDLPRRLNLQLERLAHTDPWISPVTASAGVFVSIPTPEDGLSDFIRFADNRMYENKRTRKTLRIMGG